MRSVEALRRGGAGGLSVDLSDGTSIATSSVILATGVSYRRLDAPGVEALVGRGVFDGPAVTEAVAMSDQTVVVVGGGNSAGQAAVHLSRYASTVTLLVRGPSLAAGMSDYLIRELQVATNVTMRCSCAVARMGAHHLERVEVRNASRAPRRASTPRHCSS